MSQFKQFHTLPFLWIVLILVLGACGGEGETAVTTPSATDATANALATRIMAATDEVNTTANTDFTQQLEQAKSRWASHNIDDYIVGVRHSQPGWNVQFLDITVQDGVVTSHKQDCYPTRECILREIDPTEFTIDELLAVAEYVGNLNIPDHPAQITFSETYGYPSSISYEDGFWAISNFQPTTP